MRHASSLLFFAVIITGSSVMHAEESVNHITRTRPCAEPDLPYSITAEILEPFDVSKLSARLLQIPRLLPLIYIDSFTTFLREVKKIFETVPGILAPKVQVAFNELVKVYPDFFETFLVGFEVITANTINTIDTFTLDPFVNLLLAVSEALLPMDPTICEQQIAQCKEAFVGEYGVPL